MRRYGLGIARARQHGALPAIALPSVIATINEDGWSAEWRDGTPPAFAPETAPMSIAVARAGFDASGVAVFHQRGRTITRRRRRVYPDQAMDTPTTVALDDYVYASDRIAGVLNRSVETSPRPIAAWVMPSRLLVGNSVRWELIAFHRNFRNNRQVACVRVRANNGTAQTPWQTVAQTAISTLAQDANPIEVFGGDLDIAALPNGLFWLEAEVYPWIGEAASILRTEDNATGGAANREFTRRYFTKDTARALTPPLAYVASTGTNASGKWSTDPAVAAASPFADIGGALSAIADATRGTPATGGIADGCRIRVVDAVAMGSPTAVSRAQNSAALVIERAPGTARSEAIVTLNASFRPRLSQTNVLTAPLNESALMFRDVTIARTANVAIAGEAAVPLQLHLWNVTINNGGSAGAWLSTAHDYLYGVTLNGANGNLGQTANQHRLMRGLTVDQNNVAMEGWVTIGSMLTRAGPAIYAMPTKGAIHYANRYLSPQANVAPIAIGAAAAGDTVSGFVVVQNLIEVTHVTTSTPALRGPSSDTPDHGHSIQAIFAHNTITGYGSVGRCNLCYDNSPGEARDHRLVRDVGNIYVQLNTKGDVFSQDGARTGQIAYSHGVGCQGNFTMFRPNSGTIGSEFQTYAGIGSSIGASPTERNDPLFLAYAGTGGSGGTPQAGSGGGDYRLQPGSPARNRVAAIGLAYDLSGAPRASMGKEAAGAYC